MLVQGEKYESISVEEAYECSFMKRSGEIEGYVGGSGTCDSISENLVVSCDSRHRFLWGFSLLDQLSSKFHSKR